MALPFPATDSSLFPSPWPARVLAVWLGLGAVAVMLLAVPSSLFDLERFGPPKELVLHLTALGALVLLVRDSSEPPRLVAAEVPLALFTAWSAVSTLLATNHWLATRALAVTVSSGILFHAGTRVARRGAGPWLITGLALALVLAALTGLAQAYGLELDVLADSRAPGGTLGNRNFLAHLMAIGAPLVLLLLAEAGGPRRAGLVATGFGLMVTALVLSRSRASWLGFLVSGSVMLFAWLIARGGGRTLAPRGRLRAGAVALLLGLLAAIVVPNSLTWRSDSPYRDTLRDLTNAKEGSGRGRLIQYRNSIRLLRIDPVFGAGPGNWPVQYPRVTTPGDPSFARADPMPTNPWPSSDWVAFLTERGVVGAVLLLASFAAMALTALRRLRRDDPGLVRRSIALLGMLTAALVTGAFDAVLLLAPPALVVFSAAGALLPASGTVAAVPLPRKWIVALAAIGLVFSIARNAGQLRSMAVAGPGWPVERLERAVRTDPGSYRLHLMIAQRTRCARGLSHAIAAAGLFPYHSAPKRVIARCR